MGITRLPNSWREKGAWCELNEKFVSQIRFEVGEIEHLIVAYAELLATSVSTMPDQVHLAALAAVLHSFYSGVERIFLTIANSIDGMTPTGQQWHRDLLAQMTIATRHRQSVLSTGAAAHLRDYLAFRHFFRHTYSFYLDWDEMAELVRMLPAVWAETKGDIEHFLTTIDLPHRP